MKYYKCLGKNGVAANGGSGQWNLPQNGNPAEWMPKIEEIIPCRSGYHLCRAEDLIVWLNEEIYEAEGKGEFIHHEKSKDVFGEARLIRKIEVWNERTTRLFAADCAEHVLRFFESKYPNDLRPRKSIEAARDFANGKIDAAARAAAGDAARAAARAAAGDAARAAAWAAAGAAAGDAAWDAAWAAAWAAAGAAEKKWQTEKLCEILGIEEQEIA